MYYCRNCKIKNEGPACPACGKPFTPADEIVNCPGCGKMFFKPSHDFKCTRCGVDIKLNAFAPQGQWQQPMMQQPQMQNPYGQPMPQAQPQMQNQGFVPPMQQQGQWQQPTMQDANAQQTELAEEEKRKPKINADFMPFDDKEEQQQGDANKEYNDIINDLKDSSSDESFRFDIDAQNAEKANEQGVDGFTGMDDDNDDFASLFGSSSMGENNDNGEEQQGFDAFANNSNTNDGATYDENGYEVVNVGSSGGGSGKKGKGKSKGGNGGGGGSSRAKIVATVTFILLLISIGFIGYLTLGKYINTDPCQRSWTEYANAAKLVKVSEFTESISWVESSNDGKYAIYKLEGVNICVIFKIQKGIVLGTFFDNSNAEVLDVVTESKRGEQSISDYFHNYINTLL